MLRYSSPTLFLFLHLFYGFLKFLISINIINHYNNLFKRELSKNVWKKRQKKYYKEKDQEEYFMMLMNGFGNKEDMLMSMKNVWEES